VILQAQRLAKRFGPVVALERGDFELEGNEIHAIVGDNGAGKSTLIKMFTGVHAPDAGDILFDGHVIDINGPRMARELGIATVYQDLALVEHLDVAGNLFLGHEQRKGKPWSWFGLLDRRGMRARAAHEMSRLSIDIESVDQTVLTLSGGQRQAVAIARGIAWGTRVVIMDEPTAALGVREAAAVLALVKEVKKSGLAVIMISHNLPQVFAVADRITVLRHCRTVGTVFTTETTPDHVVAMITGIERDAQELAGGMD
jgi:ABC-type sugar transport system ATPase subunit